MVNVLDVAKYILQKMGETTAMKLQKLVYYAQAWSLVWDSKPLFAERIEAWANGPVVPELYSAHKGAYLVDATKINKGDPRKLTTNQKESIDAVLEVYGDKTPQWLSELTHMENPWKDAREGLSIGERSSREITHAAMAEYYESLL